MVKDYLKKLEEIGQKPDGEIDLAQTALLIAAIDQPETHLERYQTHLTKITECLHDKMSDRGVLPDAHDELMARIELINQTIRTNFDYDGDDGGHENIDNTSLIQVIERRKGIPVALGIVYMHAARSLGWVMDGLNFPGHFLIRLDYQGQREIIDPFYDGQLMNAARLRALVKTMIGPGAELNHDYYTPMENRSILLRLCNNRKTILIANDDFKGALQVVKTMLLIAPKNVRLRFDAGVLSARLNEPEQAIDYLEYYVEHIGDPRAASEASSLLLSLKESLS